MSVRTNVDVAILGGGPAGAATALALKRHAPELSVLLVERSDEVKRRIGETLPPGVEPVFEQLGIWDTFRRDGHLPAYGTRTAWGGGELVEQSFIMSARGDGWHLDRRRFDQFLLDEAQWRGAEVCRPGRVQVASRDEGGWTLDVRRSSAEFQTQARFVVDATGRAGWFARRYGGAVATALDGLVGAFRFFQADSGAADNPLTLTEPVEIGYWYAAAIPGGELAVALMTDADLLREAGMDQESAWTKALAQTEHCGPLVAGLAANESVQVTAADSRMLDPICGDTWLAVGDAASTFDPLSSLGIFKALRSGLFAAYTIADRLAGDHGALDRYQTFVGGGFENYQATHRKYYQTEQRWPDAPFWSRRHAEIKLDPAIWLVAAAGKSPGPSHLTQSETQRVCELCRTPTQAHQVVAMLRELGAFEASDHRRILGLQDLIATGGGPNLTPGLLFAKAIACPIVLGPLDGLESSS